MLLAALLTLRPKARITLPASLGWAIHAWFLNQVRERDPSLSERLHAPNAPRPFTLSPLLGTGRPIRGEITLEPGQEYRLRLTSLEADFSRFLHDTLLPALPGSEARFYQARMEITAATCDPKAHPWAGMNTYEQLSRTYLMEMDRPPRRSLTLHFASPTTFRQDSTIHDEKKGAERRLLYNTPLPLPALVFDSYLRRWNHFAPVELPAGARRYAEACVAVSRYRLRTVLVEFGRMREVGFVGKCSFTAMHFDAYWLRVMNLLAAFSFYAGTGRHTVLGLGQTRWLGA